MSPLTVRVARTDQEIAELRPFWGEASDRLENAPEYFELISACRDTIETPYLIAVEDGSGPVALLLCRIEQIRLTSRFAYFRLGNFPLRSLTAVYNGLVGRADAEVLELMAGAIAGALDDGTAEVANIRYVRERSLLDTALTNLAIPTRRRSFGPVEVHRALDISGSYDDVINLRSSSTRKRLRRYARSIEGTDGFRLDVIDDATNLPAVMDDLETVAAKTYQRAMNSGFFHNEEWARVMQMGFERGWFRLWIAYADGKPVSYAGGFTYRGVFYSYLKGYDPDYAQLSIGTYLLLRMISDLIDAGDAKMVDYGFGDAEYKRSYSTESWSERTHMLFAPSFKGERVAMTIKTVNSLSETAKSVARRLNIEQRAKTLLRRNMADKDRSPGGE